MNERRLAFMLEVNRDQSIIIAKQSSLLPFEIAYTAGVLEKKKILDSMNDQILLL